MAATTRTNVPQVNLKDRIAALQQRNAGTSQATQGDHKHVLPSTGSLRDKIATFEKKGAVPVPRGSFGLGAPPVDDGSSRRHGEMYANRVPGLPKPTVVPDGVVAPTATLPLTRRLSTSDMATPPTRMFSPTPSSSGSPEPAFESVSEFGGSPPTSPCSSAGVKGQMGRRSVSDILNKLGPLTPSLNETVSEDTEEIKARSDGSKAPVIVVSRDPGMTDERDELKLPQSLADSTQPPDATEQNAAAKSTQSPTASSPDSVTSDGAIPAATAVKQMDEPKTTTHDVKEPYSAEDLPSSNSEEFVPSETDGPSANSSKVPTPTDLVNFPSSSKSVDDSAAASDSDFYAGDEGLALDAQRAFEALRIVSPPPPADVPMSPLSPISPSGYEDADHNLSLDTSDAVIVTQPVQHITPTRAVLVPVPPARAPSSPTTASPVSPANSPVSPATPTLSSTSSSASVSAQSSKTAQFRAVVHRKVPDALQLKPGRSSRLPQAVQGGSGEPDTAGLSDLAALLADAALLEQHLSGSGSPRPEKLPTLPAITPEVVLAYLEQEPATPRVSVSALQAAPLAEPQPERAPLSMSPEPTVETEAEPEGFHDPIDFPTVTDSSDLDLELAPMPATPMQRDTDTRSVLETPPPPPPTKSPRHRYFSTLLPRTGKSSTNPSATSGLLSMPGAYPRNSVSMYSSGDSEEDAGAASLASDASSVRSSSKSTKSRKGLGRATSFADRIFNRSSRTSTSAESYVDPRLSTHEYSHIPPVPAIHHGATVPMSRPQRESLAEDRPMSWFSVSTGDSPLDNRFFDSFPSVPSDIPGALPENAQASYLSPGHAGPPSRSATLPPRQSSLPKRR